MQNTVGMQMRMALYLLKTLICQILPLNTKPLFLEMMGEPNKVQLT